MGLDAHIERNAKAYGGAIAAVGSSAFSEHVLNVGKWFLEITGTAPPPAVGLSIRYIFVAVMTWFTVHYVTMYRHE